MNFQVPEYVRTLVPYVPGKPIEETQRELGIRRVTKLASNENPLGPSPRAVLAMRKGLGQLHRYPDGAAFHLKRTLAKLLDVESCSIIVGNGSNEIIDFIIRTFCEAGDAIVTSQAAFIAYRICAQIQGVRTLEAPIDSRLKFDPQAMLARIRDDQRARVVFIANPNNPTGSYLNGRELRDLLKGIAAIRGGSVLVALDYAYWEYVTATDLPDPMKLLKEFPNVIVLRTFSKVYGLAGLRVGYAVGDPEVIASLEKVRQPFNLNSLALLGAAAAAGDTAFRKRACKVNEQGMRLWTRGLQDLGVPFWPSQGNFLLIDAMGGFGKPGGEVFQECLRRGVIFRPVANYGLPNALRISIGTAEENRIGIKALQGCVSVRVARPGASPATAAC